MMGVLNFAHASFCMLGAYFAYAISTQLGFWPVLVIAPLLVGVAGAMAERYGLHSVHKFGHIPELLFTFGLSYVLVEAVQMVWGRAAVMYAIPAEPDGPLFTLFTTNFPKCRAFMMLIAQLMLVSVFLGLTKTRIGLVIHSALTHPDMVEALGHNVPRVVMLVFCGMGSLASVLQTFAVALSILSQIGTVVISALSCNMLLGQGGMLSFGHAVYSGLGAFFGIHAIHLASAGKVWLPRIPLVGGLAGMFFGMLFGYVTTRKAGTTFAMITMGTGELVFACSLMFPDFFGGEGGITTHRVYGEPFPGMSFGPQIQVY